MTFETKKLPKSAYEIEVTIPFEEFEKHVQNAAVFLSEENDIPGFRKGKAPFNMVKDKFGEGAIYEKAADLAIQKTFPKVMREIMEDKKSAEETFVPVGRPEAAITKLAPGNEFKFKISLSCLPAFSLPDYKSIASRVMREKIDATVEEKEIEDSIKWILESRAPLVTVNREAKMGDTVEIDFEVRQNGVKIENGESRNHPLVLGKGNFVPGFEERVAGMKAGDVKEFSLPIPQEWQHQNFAGKNLNFKVTMKVTQERKIPELTEEYVKTLGNFSNIEDFKKTIKEGILKEKNEKEDQRVKAKMLEEIASGAKMDIPDLLVEKEIDKMLEEIKSGVTQMGMKWEDYLSHLKKEEGELRKTWRDDAEKRARAALCLREIGIKEKIVVPEEEIEKRANQYLSQFSSASSVEDTPPKIDPEDLKEYAQGIIRNEKVFRLLEKQ